MNNTRILLVNFSLLIPIMMFSQQDWKVQRDWVIGEYVGYQVDSTIQPDIKVPFSFIVKYSKWSSYPALDNDSTVSIDPKNLWFKVRKDSVLVPYYTDYPTLREWGKFYQDSTLEFLYIEPFIFGGGHRVYNWGKRVKSYVRTEEIDDSKIFKIWPNPSIDYLNLSEVSKIKFISIFNSQGIEVLSNPIITNQRIDISMLPEGLYWIQVFFEGKVDTKQFLKIDSK